MKRLPEPNEHKGLTYHGGEPGGRRVGVETGARIVGGGYCRRRYCGGRSKRKRCRGGGVHPHHIAHSRATHCHSMPCGVRAVTRRNWPRSSSRPHFENHLIYHSFNPVSGENSHARILSDAHLINKV